VGTLPNGGFRREGDAAGSGAEGQESTYLGRFASIVVKGSLGHEHKWVVGTCTAGSPSTAERSADEAQRGFVPMD
jgi:hypothetical protein